MPKVWLPEMLLRFVEQESGEVVESAWTSDPDVVRRFFAELERLAAEDVKKARELRDPGLAHMLRGEVARLDAHRPLLQRAAPGPRLVPTPDGGER